jgi:RHS repeat-associated protein
MELTYYTSGGSGDAGDQYTGLDRFGRVVDQRWDLNGTDLERLKYGYDQVNNQVWRQNTVAEGLSANQDQYYTQDGLYQIKTLQRGTLNATQTGISGTPTWEEDWNYDPLGNWNGSKSAYQTRVAGTTTLNQNRTHSTVNEITGLTTSTGTAWTAPGYDAAGNMTGGPQPLSPANGYVLTYDAWNRLMQLKNGNMVVAAYAYDGASRRVTKTVGNTLRHYYYDDQWRVVEERLNMAVTADRRFVWGVRRLDDLILRDRTSSIRLYALDDKINVTAVIDVSGTVQERYCYNGFGGVNYMNSNFNPVPASAFDWETLFDSYRYDTESGFYRVRYRYLHPLLGRWLSRDPLGELGFEVVRVQSTLLFSNRTSPDSVNRCPIGKKCVNQLSDKKAKLLLGRINLYEFVKNSPVGQIDVYGLINSHFPQYGNYCGGGWCGGKVVKLGEKCNFSVAPINEMDTCCQAHDKCYDNACKGKVDQSKVHDCDKTLCQCMKDVDKSNFTSEGDEIHYGELVTWACGIRGGGPIG